MLPLLYNYTMAKIDEVKEWLNFLNRLFTIGLVTLLGIVGWLFLNYKKVETVLTISALIGAFALLVVLTILARKIIANIRTLKDLE